jgi:hypothetical protein
MSPGFISKVHLKLTQGAIGKPRLLFFLRKSLLFLRSTPIHPLLGQTNRILIQIFSLQIIPTFLLLSFPLLGESNVPLTLYHRIAQICQRGTRKIRYASGGPDANAFPSAFSSSSPLSPRIPILGDKWYCPSTQQVEEVGVKKKRWPQAYPVPAVSSHLAPAFSCVTRGGGNPCWCTTTWLMRVGGCG